MKRILSIVGARPQFIKASALSREWATGDWGVVEEVLHTGQHHDEGMSGVFFRELGMAEPAHRLHIRSAGVAGRMGDMVVGIAEVVERTRPDALLVYGDTDSTWAGAWVAARWGIPLAHVEAGLRSFDRSMPEEVNRVLTDHVARWCFCPTDEAVRNLEREGVREGVFRTGDLQWDTANWMAEQVPEPAVREGALLTMHRPANVDDPGRLRQWLEAVAALGVRVHFPVHPRTAAVCERTWGEGWRAALEAMGFALSGPLGYRELVERVRSVQVVLTDSGGLQKEAYGLRRPCVVLRPVTEWVELVEHGAARLCAEPEAVAEAWLWAQGATAPPPGLYGDGRAAREVARAMSESAWR